MSALPLKPTGSVNATTSLPKRRRRSESKHTVKGKRKQPPAEPEEKEFVGFEDSASEAGRKVQGNLYDAVAGRLDDQGFILDGPRRPTAPDAILFRRKNAPVRYEEDDQYFAHRDLPPHVKLPESDLLKAVHTYVSDFYASGKPGETEMDYQSMDETALLAIGILLEEACGQTLGKTGDLAFVEGERMNGNG